jgi:alanine dehydrogenase
MFYDRPTVGTLILTRSDLERILSMALAVPAVERAFAAHGRGETRMPVKVYLPLPEHDGDFRAMPAFMDGAAGVKWVNAHPQNPSRHRLPTVRGVYILSNPATASPLAVMDATLLTAFRTGAAGAVASRHLARAGARSLGLVGCGVQAHYLLEAHRHVYGDALTEIVAADAVPAVADRFVAAHAADAAGRLRVGTIEEAAACDLVCTQTPSRTPVVHRAWLRPGAHVNAMGADAPGKQELESQVVLDARVFVDDLDQASESGEVNVPLHTGVLARAQLRGTLGEVVAGKLTARTAPDSDELTLFDSTGLAVQDVALARAAVDVARAQGLGLEVPLVD